MKAFYKTILLLYGCYFSFSATGQNLNLVSPITISMPNNPVANTDDWGKGAQPFIITAKKNTPNELQSWMLVTIKKGGSKICGSNTPQTAPEVYFDVPVKTWVGATAISLLGNGCVLQPGDYELCVQFYLKDRRNIIGENCKSFTIKETKPETYAPPQNILPADNKKFTGQEMKAPITFRWTPIVPKPKAKVKYTVRIWDIPIRASKSQVIKTQPPVIIKETNELTQLSIPASEFKQSKSENNAYAWNVEASKPSAMGDIEMLGTSEATSFSIASTYIIKLESLKINCPQNGVYNFTIQIGNPNSNIAIFDKLEISVVNGITLGCPITITSISPAYGTTIAANGTISVSGSFPYSGTVNTICLSGYIKEQLNPTLNKATTYTCDTLKCVCDFCQKAVEFDHDLGTATISGNNLNIVQPIWDMAGNTIVSVKAEIISFERYVGDECMNCNKDAALWGNFTSGRLGTLAGTFGLAASPVSGNTHHTLYWNPPTGYAGALNPFKLTINTPPLSNLTCCCEKIKTKIRYTYTFKDKATGECKTCNGGVFEYEVQKGTCPANPASTGGGVK